MSDDDKQKIRERRMKLLQWHLRRPKGVSLALLASQLQCGEDLLVTDWERRHSWLAEYLGYDDIAELIQEIIFHYKSNLEKCWEMMLRYDESEAKNAAASALKSHREGVNSYVHFLQSMGFLTSVDVESPRRVDEVPDDLWRSLTSEEQASINHAYDILDRLENERRRSQSIH